MKEFIEKLIYRLEEYKDSHLIERNSERLKHCKEVGHRACDGADCFLCVWDKATEIVNQLAEEYKDINIITDFLQYVRDNADNYDEDNGWSLSDLIDLSIKFCETDGYNNGRISDIKATNAQKIRAMSDEELAEFFSERDKIPNRYECKEIEDWVKWLQSEAE